MDKEISPRGRGKSQKSIRLINAAIRILEEIQPASIRAVCYRLFIDGLIPSMEKTNTNKVSTQLVWAREQGLLPWTWIVDETREAERVNTWDNPQQLIDAAVRQYRKNYWSTQPEWVEVWSEKGTIRGTLKPVLDEYGVTFRVMHGYGSATSLHDIAEESMVGEKLLTVLYVGDWDPSGMHMSEVDLPRRIELYRGIADINRVALNESDVKTRGLPSFKVGSKAKDPRYQWYVERYGHRCWELDALSPVVLRERVGEQIQRLLDVEAWNHAIDIEAAECESMASILSKWPGISMPATRYPEAGV